MPADTDFHLGEKYFRLHWEIFLTQRGNMIPLCCRGWVKTGVPPAVGEVRWPILPVWLSIDKPPSISPSLKVRRMYSLYIALSFCSTHPQSLIHLSFSHLETSAQEGIFHRHLIFLKDQLPNLHKELLLGGRGVVEGNSCFALLASSFHQLVLASSFFLPTGGGHYQLW